MKRFVSERPLYPESAPSFGSPEGRAAFPGGGAIVADEFCL